MPSMFEGRGNGGGKNLNKYTITVPMAIGHYQHGARGFTLLHSVGGQLNVSVLNTGKIVLHVC